MAHLTYEYTANLGDDANVAELLLKSNRVLIAQYGVFPIGGIRSRAIRLDDWCMADGEADYAFVHGTLKIGAGRSADEKSIACKALFSMVKDHFAGLYSRRYLALSLELYEFEEAGTWKHNNVHARFRK